MSFLTHDGVWAALDALAKRSSLSPSGLAKAAGLDPTSFNKSKRVTGEGRQRWPSTESIAKALKATGASLDEFMALIPDTGLSAVKRSVANGAMHSRTSGIAGVSYRQPRSVPLLGLAQAGVGGFFDDGGFPAGQGWDQVPFPAPDAETAYALEVTGDSMLPLYRDGDVIIVQPDARVRKGDRVVVRTRAGEVMAKVLLRQTVNEIELRSLNPDHADRKLPMTEVDWVARIIWASQ